MRSINKPVILPEAVTIDMPRHPTHGQRVAVIRRDPFKRFIIVRLARKVGDYSKGDELRLQLKHVRP